MKLSGILLVLKGIAMGAADVVPGVSGGTIAFITGIYEELVDSIKNLNGKAVKILFTQGFSAFWKHINGFFFVKLLSGIGISILSLSKLIIYLLDYHPILIWSFFFGLIIASVFLVGKEITQWKINTIIGLVFGTVFSFWITIVTPTESPDSYLFLFFAGFVAIIAMILPGISGAFILLIMGAYYTVIGTLNNFREALVGMNVESLLENGSKIAVFALGCLIGITSFSHVLSWMFKHYKNTTLAILTGFMAGSMNKIWPWKTTIMTRINHEGKADESIVPFIQDNVWPWNYGHLSELEKSLTIIPDTNPQIIPAIGIMIFGILLITVLYRFAPVEE